MRLRQLVWRATIILSVVVMGEVAPMERTLRLAEPVEYRGEAAGVLVYALIVLAGALAVQALMES